MVSIVRCPLYSETRIDPHFDGFLLKGLQENFSMTAVIALFTVLPPPASD